MAKAISGLNKEPKPNSIRGQGAWTTNLHLPPSLKRLLPLSLWQFLHEVKGRFVTGDFSRHREFPQSAADCQATATMSIVIPIHDAPAVTQRCLASVEKYAPESEVILVDDASRFRETLNVIEQFGTRRGWKVVRHDKAVGHSEACRAGAKLATRPYLCLLNSDTVVTPWCWRQLKELFENDRNVGIAGPSTSNSGNPQALPSVGNLSAYWNDGQIWAFAERLLTDFQEPVAMDLPWISGFALFIRRSLWEEMDGFNRDLQDYGNEVELCRRAAAKGFRLVWVRNSYIHHFGRQSYVDSIGEEGILARIEAAEKRLGSTNRSLDPSS